MTITQLILNEGQQEVVDRLRALPGAQDVTIQSSIIEHKGKTTSRMEISGGADGPDPARCAACDHRPGRSYLSMHFEWVNNSFYKARISVNHAAKRRPPRRRMGMKAALNFMEKFCQEEFVYDFSSVPTDEGV